MDHQGMDLDSSDEETSAGSSWAEELEAAAAASSPSPSPSYPSLEDEGVREAVDGLMLLSETSPAAAAASPPPPLPPPMLSLEVLPCSLGNKTWDWKKTRSVVPICSAPAPPPSPENPRTTELNRTMDRLVCRKAVFEQGIQTIKIHQDEQRDFNEKLKKKMEEPDASQFGDKPPSPSAAIDQHSAEPLHENHQQPLDGHDASLISGDQAGQHGPGWLQPDRGKVDASISVDQVVDTNQNELRLLPTQNGYRSMKSKAHHDQRHEEKLLHDNGGIIQPSFAFARVVEANNQNDQGQRGNEPISSTNKSEAEAEAEAEADERFAVTTQESRSDGSETRELVIVAENHSLLDIPSNDSDVQKSLRKEDSSGV